MVALLFEVAASSRVLFYFLVVFAYFAYSFKIFMIVFDDRDIWFFVFVFELVFAVFVIFLLFFFFLFVLFVSFAFFLFLL